MKKLFGWKCVALLTATSGLFLTTSVPYAAFASDTVTITPTVSTTAAPSGTITQDQAVAAAKNFLSIPDGYQLNNASFQASGNGFSANGIWNLDFINTKQNQNNAFMHGMHFTIDGTTGDVLNMNLGSPASGDLNSALSDEESQKIATDLLHKLSPKQADQVQLLTNQPSVSMGPTMNARMYEFDRIVDGIPYTANHVSITLDAQGNLIAYSKRWDDNLTFPSSKPAITADQALAAYTKALQVTLEYNLNNYMSSSSQASLYYVPYSVNGLDQFPLIDASSGQVIDYSGQAVNGSQLPAITPLSTQAKTPPTKELTQEQAIDAVQQMAVDLDGYTFGSANYQSGSDTQDPEWNLTYNKKDGSSPRQISIDAKTGDLMDYRTFMFGGPSQSDSNTAPIVSYEQAKQTALEFILKAMPTRTDSIALIENNSQNNKVQGAYSFSFAFLHDGIPTNRQFNIDIRYDTGKVGNFFSFTPTESTTYASKEQLISQDEAKQAYLNSDKYKLTLQYLPIYAKGKLPVGQPDKTELVYAPATLNSPQLLLDAKTSQWVSPYSGTSEDLSKITDIKGHWAEKYLSNLVTQGILQPKNNKVFPDQAVTRGEAVRTLVMLYRHFGGQIGQQPYFQDVPSSDPNYSYIQQAAYFHLIDVTNNKFRPNDTLTRQELAEWIATALNYNALTEVPGVMNNHFSDLGGVDAVHVNDIAVAAALGLMVGNNDQFQPKDPVTRAQMALVMTRLADRMQRN